MRLALVHDPRHGITCSECQDNIPKGTEFACPHCCEMTLCEHCYWKNHGEHDK